MKKIILLIICTILVTGCASNELSKEKEKYLNYVKELKSVNETSKDIPFDIEVKYDSLSKYELRYQVIIDNVKENIYDIEALAIHNKQTNDIFPSIGIFDKKEDLIKGKKPSGVILVGYIDYEGNINDFKCKTKLLVKYKDKNKKEKIVYYVTKK